MAPGGREGALVRKTIFILKNVSSRTKMTNFNQTWYKSFLGKVLFKGEIITKIQKLSRIILKSSPEPQSHRARRA
jgi:hypothetical protein